MRSKEQIVKRLEGYLEKYKNYTMKSYLSTDKDECERAREIVDFFIIRMEELEWMLSDKGKGGE